jgi:ABC-type antimicrobial peptide transport system permease subunit
MDQVVAGSMSDRRFLATLMACFTALALALAAVGVYGLVAFSVATRTREIGLRMTLGATRGAVLGLVMRQGLLTAAAGAGLGTLLAAAAGRGLGSLLHEVSPGDPAVLLAAPALLLVVAALATLVPAARAARIAPQEALRRG